MSAAATHKISVDEYYRMAETGALEPDARVELLDGQIIDMSPIGPFHSSVTIFLTDFLTAKSNRRWLTSPNGPLHLNDHSELQPDFMLLKVDPLNYRRKNPQPADVYLLIEISDSTLERDIQLKLPAYGRNGIQEVWIVNLVDETVEIYTQPNFSGYASKTVFSSGETVSPVAFPDLKLDVAELYKH